MESAHLEAVYLSLLYLAVNRFLINKTQNIFFFTRWTWDYSIISSWEQPTSFITLHCGLSFWMSFTIFSIVSIDSSFVGSYIPFQLLIAGDCKNCRPICISRFLGVFVFWNANYKFIPYLFFALGYSLVFSSAWFKYYNNINVNNLI